MSCARGYGVEAQSGNLTLNIPFSETLDACKSSVTVQKPHTLYIVELEDDQHVLVMSNLPLTFHPKEQFIGGRFKLQTVRSGEFVLYLGSLNRILVDVQSVHIMSKAG